MAPLDPCSHPTPGDHLLAPGTTSNPPPRTVFGCAHKQRNNQTGSEGFSWTRHRVLLEQFLFIHTTQKGGFRGSHVTPGPSVPGYHRGILVSVSGPAGTLGLISCLSPAGLCAAQSCPLPLQGSRSHEMHPPSPPAEWWWRKEVKGVCLRQLLPTGYNAE